MFSRREQIVFSCKNDIFASCAKKKMDISYPPTRKCSAKWIPICRHRSRCRAGAAVLSRGTSMKDSLSLTMFLSSGVPMFNARRAGCFWTLTDPCEKQSAASITHVTLRTWNCFLVGRRCCRNGTTQAINYSSCPIKAAWQPDASLIIRFRQPYSAHLNCRMSR